MYFLQETQPFYYEIAEPSCIWGQWWIRPGIEAWHVQSWDSEKRSTHSLLWLCCKFWIMTFITTVLSYFRMLTVIYYWYVLTEKWCVLSEKWRSVKLVILFSDGASVSLYITSSGIVFSSELRVLLTFEVYLVGNKTTFWVSHPLLGRCLEHTK